jgi:acetyl-CoA acetyltransferase
VPHRLYQAAAIAGVDESDEIGRVPGKTSLQLHAEAAVNALADAGIDISEVDGIATAGVSTLQTAEYLGITPRYTDSTAVGGSSFVIHVGHATEAIADGRASVVLITHGQGHLGGRGGGRPAADQSNLAAQYESPYGVLGAPYAYSLACMRHMAQYGTTKEQLAEIAVQTRQWAAMNPKALMRDPITVDDVLNSRMISYPFNILDCCLVTDAGGAVVLVSPERAKDLPKKPVWVLGMGEAHDHQMISQMPDVTRTPAQYSGPAALGMAGVGLADIDVVELYDCYTFTVVITLEDYGFCAKGEGGPFVASGVLGPGGKLKLNTGGGQLSSYYMWGMTPLSEAIIQARGQAGARQAEQHELVLVSGNGGVLDHHSTLVLAGA